jgi:hypothetical protein
MLLFSLTLFHTVQLTLQIILFFIMLVIGHTEPAIYAPRYNGLESGMKLHLNFHNL